MPVKVKICGLSTPETVEAAQDAGAVFLGFVFCEKSPRHISYAQAAELGEVARVPKVAVTIDASDSELEQIMQSLKPEYIQLHGSESDERAGEIKKKFGVKLIRSRHPGLVPGSGSGGTDNRTQGQARDDGTYEFLLFDSPGGGTGKQFDYAGFAAPTQPWFLSGGLNASNVADAVAQTGAQFVDVSSGVESSRGVKDLELIKQFIRKVHGISTI